MREALKTFEIFGIVECLHGSGCYVANNVSNAMSEPLSIMMILEKGNYRHTYELRRALEEESAFPFSACLELPAGVFLLAALPGFFQ